MRFDLTYGWIFFWSAIGLLFERVWSSFWPALSVVFFYAGLSLINFPLMFGNTGHLVLLVAFATGFVFCAMRLGTAFRFPQVRDIERHIEEQSALAHRPLESLQDRPIDGLTPGALALWQKHLRQMSKLRHKLCIYRPKPDTARQDRYALRHAALMLFILGFFIAQDQALPRLQQGLQPDISLLIPRQEAALDMWIVPPEYTMKTPVFLASAQNSVPLTAKDIHVPQGSLLKIRMSGHPFAPRLSYAGEAHDFTKISSRNFTLEMPLETSGALHVRQGFRNLGRWNVTATPDTPPHITLEDAGPAPRGILKVLYSVKDDYGITKITGTIRPTPDMKDDFGDVAYVFDLSLPSSGQERNVASIDLTSHIWAGFPVMLTLTAEDNMGQVTESTAKTIILPSRHFTNPLAQSVITERQKLLWPQNILGRKVISNNLIAILTRPALYKGDIRIFMALNAAARRLMYDTGMEATASVQDVLWDIALKLEDGGLSLAARNLSDALQKLSQALHNKNTPKEELEALQEDVREKMQAYMQTLARELQQRLAQGKKTQNVSPELANKFMKHIDIQQLMDQMRALANGDSREIMQKMAEYLRNAVDNLDLSQMEKMQEEQAKAMEALQEMQDLIHRQESLFDRTNKLAPEESGAEEAKEQSGIRAKLGDIARQLGESLETLPENIGKADQSMKEAEGALKKGTPKDSLPHQKTALEELQKGLDDSIKQMSEQMQQTLLSFGLFGQESNFGEGYDPLGRKEDTGTTGTDDIKIPDEKERRRVQQIIEELRGRRNDFERPKVERDYIDRLLEMFN